MIQISIFVRSRAISIRPRFYPINAAIAVLSCRARERDRALRRSIRFAYKQAYKTQIPSMRIKWYLHLHL
jgi:hypothetical protein